jgi:hypothetical protein
LLYFSSFSPSGGVSSVSRQPTKSIDQQRHQLWANSHILEADLAIAKAKKKLGFK